MNGLTLYVQELIRRRRRRVLDWTRYINDSTTVLRSRGNTRRRRRKLLGFLMAASCTRCPLVQWVVGHACTVSEHAYSGVCCISPSLKLRVVRLMLVGLAGAGRAPTRRGPLRGYCQTARSSCHLLRPTRQRKVGREPPGPGGPG